MLQIAAVGAGQYLAQVDQAVDAFLEGASSRVGGLSRCSTFRWCLKKDTSLVVVSMRSIWPNLSYILMEALPKRCLMHVAFDPDPEPRAQLLRQLWGDLTAEKSGGLFGFHAQHRLPGGLFIEWPERGGERNARSVAIPPASDSSGRSGRTPQAPDSTARHSGRAHGATGRARTRPPVLARGASRQSGRRHCQPW